MSPEYPIREVSIYIQVFIRTHVNTGTGRPLALRPKGRLRLGFRGGSTAIGSM